LQLNAPMVSKASITGDLVFSGNGQREGTHWVRRGRVSVRPCLWR
jgi:hypothetical protein